MIFFVFFYNNQYYCHHTFHYFSYVHSRSQKAKCEAHVRFENESFWQMRHSFTARSNSALMIYFVNDVHFQYQTFQFTPEKEQKLLIFRTNLKMAWHEKNVLENGQYLHLQHRICTSKMKIIFKNKNLWIRSRWDIKKLKAVITAEREGSTQ